jgi:serine beta-lactamase-like protein LACTB, mitochondrial
MRNSRRSLTLAAPFRTPAPSRDREGAEGLKSAPKPVPHVVRGVRANSAAPSSVPPFRARSRAEAQRSLKAETQDSRSCEAETFRDGSGAFLRPSAPSRSRLGAGCTGQGRHGAATARERIQGALQLPPKPAPQLCGESRDPVRLTLSAAAVLALLLLTACPRTRIDRTASPAAPGAAAASSFRNVIAEFQSRQQNAAISVGIRHRGKTVFREATGLANRETGLPADAQMAFSIASVTKAFTGAALLKLVEAHRIDLDAEIQRYVPEFPRHPSGRPVTVRLLAHHLGALRHWGPERNAALYARHFDDVNDILPLFQSDPWVPDLAPATRYSYSSYGYNALAMAIQKAAGKPYQAYVAETVLNPLRLASVQFDRPGLGGARRPSRYSWYDLTDFHDLTDRPQLVPDWDYSHNLAAGGLIANVEDLLTFGRALRAPGLLGRESLDLVWTQPEVSGVQSPMSFGWFPKSTPSRITISGSNAGVQAALAVWRDEDLVIALLANSWGKGSRSGEFMDDSPKGLIGRLAAVCGVR